MRGCRSDMIITTVREVLKDCEDGIDHKVPCMYVVKDGTDVLYVGITKDCIENRFWRHIDNLSPLGRLIKNKAKKVQELRVEIWEPRDWRKWGLSPRVNIDARKRIEVGDAERIMIRRTRPPLNTMCNLRPRPVPDWIKKLIYHYDSDEELEDVFRLVAQALE